MDRKKQYGIIYGLLHKSQMREHKDALLEGYGVESLTDMTDKQLTDLVERLGDMVSSKAAKVSDKTRKLRSNVLIAASEYFGRAIIDAASWAAFNTLMMDKRIAGKMLVEMTDEELKTVNNKIRNAAKKKETTKAVENRFAVLN